MEKLVHIFGTESAVLFVPQHWGKDLHYYDLHEIVPLTYLREKMND